MFFRPFFHSEVLAAGICCAYVLFKHANSSFKQRAGLQGCSAAHPSPVRASASPSPLPMPSRVPAAPQEHSAAGQLPAPHGARAEPRSVWAPLRPRPSPGRRPLPAGPEPRAPLPPPGQRRAPVPVPPVPCPPVPGPRPPLTAGRSPPAPLPPSPRQAAGRRPHGPTQGPAPRQRRLPERGPGGRLRGSEEAGGLRLLPSEGEFRCLPRWLSWASTPG